MKKKIKFVISIFLTLTLFVILMPILINESYMENKGYLTVWDGADVLAFYGSILAALGGIAGVFFTVRHSQKQYREDTRLRHMPYIAIDKLNDDDFYKRYIKSNSTEFIIDNDSDSYLITYCARKGATFPRYLNADQILNIEKNGDRMTEVNERVAHYKSYYYFLPLKITNVGSGVALKTQIGLFKFENGKYEITEKERKYVATQTIAPKNSVYIGIYWDLNDDAAVTTYKLDILCSDVSGRRYIRSIEYKFERNTLNQFTITRIDSGENKIYSDI